MTVRIDRRGVLAGGLAGASWLLVSAPDAFAADGGVPVWAPGTLEIHHIDTGRGNATFILGPDGTTILIDCGASVDDLETSAPPRPNALRAPGEWVARYIRRHAATAGREDLDYIVATHIHPDHVGDIAKGAVAGAGGYVPTGLSQVDALVPARTVIDRAYPYYGTNRPLSAPFASNYLAWLDRRQRDGRPVAALAVGSDRQIRLRSPKAYPDFSVRNVAANGRIWTGRGTATRDMFADKRAAAIGVTPPENSCSIAMKLTYGRFSYFTGGDLNADSYDGAAPWLDVETPVAHAVGRVEVALADHHGYFDACGPAFVRSLDPQVFVIPSWHVTHPGSAQIERMLGGRPGEKARDVFALELLSANRLINARFVRKLKSSLGHVIVRVAPGGETYMIYAVDSSVEDGGRAASFGPYHCR